MEGSFKRKNVSIGEAADFLGVSIDTVRRWDEKGILTSTRPNGKNRYFSIEELEKIKYSQPLTISEAAQRLEISEATLRRLEEKGLITPERDHDKNRIYTLKCLEKFIESDYYLRRQEIEDKILSAPETKETKDSDYQDDVKSLREQHRIFSAQLQKHDRHIGKLNNFRRSFYVAITIAGMSLLVLTTIFTLLFIAYPEKTGRWFGLYSIKAVAKDTKNNNEEGKVLGASYIAPDLPSSNILGKILQPVGGLSLEITRKVSPDSYNRVVGDQAIVDVNDVLGIDSSKNIVSKYNLTFPDTSYLIIPDTDLINNLNADYIRGKVPGTESGNLAYYSDSGALTGLKVNSDQIDTKQNGGLDNSNGLSLISTCTADQTLVWNGASWVCGTVSLITDNSISWNTAYSHTSLTNNPHNVTSTQVLPIQTGQTGKVLGTDGLSVSWVNGAMVETDPVAMGYLDQNVKTISSPSFTGLSIGNLSGILKGTAGVVSAITDNSANWDAAFSTSHAAVTIGVPANGLSLSTQQLSLALSSAGTTGALSAGDWTTFSNKQGTLTLGDVTAGSTKVTIGGTGTGAVIGAGLTVDINEANITHDNLAGLTTGDPHTQYALLIGRSGGQSLSGGTDANDDITIQGTTNATRTTSYVNLQPNGGNVGIGTTSPGEKLDIAGNTSGTVAVRITNTNTSGASELQVFGGTAVGSFKTYGTGFSVASLANQAAFGTGGTATGVVVFSNGSVTSGGSGTISLRGGGYDTAAENLLLDKNGSYFTHGNVGIGTTGPLSKLSINGGLHVGGDSDAGDNNILADGTIIATGAMSASNLSGTNTGDNSANSLYSGLAASKADVGQTMYIGTTAHAINRASAAEGLTGITSLTPGANFTLSQNAVNVLTSEETGAIVNTLYLKAGNVGIGTTAPAARLEINQPTLAGTNLILTTGAGNTNLLTPLRIKSVLNGTAYEPVLETSGALRITSTDASGTGTFRLLPYAGNIWFQNTDVTKAINFSGLNGADIANANFYVTNTYFKGNVGIGTTGPDFKLDVSGGLRIEGANRLYFGGTAAGDTLGNLYHDGTDFVFSDTIKPTGYKSSDGTAGLGVMVNLTGSDALPCTMTFKDGLLTSETCP